MFSAWTVPCSLGPWDGLETGFASVWAEELAVLCLPYFRPRLVGQATREAVLKKFSALQLMPVLRAPWLAPVSLKVKKSFSVKQQILLSPTCLSSETCPVIFSLPSPHNLCNKVLSALENCHPGLVLEKFSLFLFQISHFTRYFVHHQNHMQVIGYNALNSVLNDCVKK